MSLKCCLRLLVLAIPLCLILPFIFACHTSVPLPVTAISPIPEIERKDSVSVPQRVSFNSIDRNHSTGNPVVIQALLFKPEGADLKRLPAVIALHGCGGMYSTSTAQKDTLSIRHKMMAELLVAEGYAVLFPDSFRPRGVEEICTEKSKMRTITQQNRRLDAQAALAWLQSRNDILPERIAILGWSHGGSTVLSTLNSKQSAVAGWRERSPVMPYFRAGLAFYPGCGESQRGGSDYSLSSPLTLFIGESDDWTAPGPCIDLTAKLKAAGEDVMITVYPDTFHGFDGPSNQKRRRLDVPNGVNPGRSVTMAVNPAARDDAYAKLKIFLRRHLGP